MDASTQYRLEMADDAILANADDPARVAELQAYKLRILDEVRPGRVSTTELDKPQFTGGNGEGRATQSRTERQASDKQMAFITRLLAERELPANNLHSGAVAMHATGTMAGRAASDLITWLTGLPVSTTAVRRPASERQLGLVNARRSAKGMRPLAADELFADEMDEELALIAAAPTPIKAARAVQAELESGMYKVGDVIYKVYKAVHGSGKMCAKELIKLDEPVIKRGKEHKYEFEYRGLAERFVTAADRMSLDEAKAFGAIYGVCCVCAATLTKEESIEAGIGPVCGGRV